MRRCLSRDFLPKNPPRSAVDANDRKPVCTIRRFFFVLPIYGHRREHENTIIPDDRRGIALTRDGKFPFYIVGFAPVKRWVGLRRNAGAERSSPLRPELLGYRIGHGSGYGAYQE